MPPRPSLEDLELRFDGPIPPRLLSGKTELELMIDHHAAMIRFSTVRIADFTAALARLEATPPTLATAPTIGAWITRTKAIIADHAAEKSRHEHDLAVLCHQLNTAGPESPYAAPG